MEIEPKIQLLDGLKERGNHTYSHIQLTKGNREKFREELIKTNEIWNETPGRKYSMCGLPTALRTKASRRG